VTPAEAFRERFGRPPEGVWEAPGRLNLIGDHTDYEDGLVLPLALEARVTVAAARRRDGLLRACSAELGEAELRLVDVAPGAVEGWPAYVAGPLWALGSPGGLDLLLASELPAGAGLSSSAAVECAALLAARDLYGGPADRAELARLARRGENEIAGVPSGVMDQMASLMCRAGHALLLDTRSLETEHLPLGLERAGLELLVIDTGTRRSLTSGIYAERRRECRDAALILGVRALRDADERGLGAVRDAVGEPLFRRARHVSSENARVLEVAAALREGRPAAAGPALTASHASLRDDFEVSTPALDAAVEAALGAGALGARLTGAGLGGCALALAPSDGAASVRAAVEGALEAIGLTPRLFAARGAAGARRIA
jgi:galactokinase